MKAIKVLFTTTSILVLILSLLLASCGGSDKDSDSAGSGDGNGKKEEPVSPPPSTLSIESAPMGTSLNAASYPVSGNCDVGQGDVTVTVETASPAMATCTGDPAGAYTALLDISGVTADPMSVMVEQGGNTKSLSPSPANDQNGPASAPTATPPSATVSATSHDLVIACSEAGEVVSITGSGLNPNPQTHTCAGSGAETFSLNIERGENFPSQNNLSLSSTDQYGNPAGGTTTVDVPIDTLAILPTVSIDSLPDVDASNAQSFTFEGSCSQEGQPVMVSAGALTPKTPESQLHRWFVVGKL